MATSHVVIASRYEIVEKIGEGSSSTIYLVRDKETGAYLACKKLFYQKFGLADVALLESEILTSKILVHANILRHQYVLNDRENRICYMLMEYFSQFSLGYQIVKRKEQQSPFKESTIWTFMAQLYDMLLYAHSVDKLHSTDVSIVLVRDFRPTNFFLSKRGVLQLKSVRYVKLLPFGVVEAGPEQTELPFKLLPYQAPELLLGNYYSMSADIWSLGCLLYELCTFRTFAPGRTAKDVLSSLAATRGPIFVDGYSANLSNVLSAMLQPDPKQRLTLAQLGKHPMLQSAWEKYKKFITHTKKTVGDTVPLVPLCGCGGDGYSCCLAARRRNNLSEMHITRRDLKGTSITPANLWQKQTLLKASRPPKTRNGEFDVIYLNQDMEGREVKYEQLLLESRNNDNPIGYTPNVTGLVHTQPCVAEETVQSTNKFALTQPPESYFSMHGRYPKTVFNRLVYSNENSRTEEDNPPLQTQFEQVFKVTEDQTNPGSVIAGTGPYGNYVNRTLLSTTIGGPGNMTMLGGFMGNVNVEDIFKEDAVETEDRACSPINFSTQSANYTTTELYSLRTDDGVTRHTRKHKNEFGDTISSCWQPSLKSNISTRDHLDLNEKVVSLHMPSTPNYRHTDSSYNMYPSEGSSLNKFESMYANSVSPPARQKNLGVKSNAKSDVKLSNLQSSSITFPSYYKASFYDPKVSRKSPTGSPSVFGPDKWTLSSALEQFSSDEEGVCPNALGENVNYKRSNYGSCYDEPLRLEYHKAPAQVPILYNGMGVSYLDIMRNKLATTRAVGPDKKKEKVKKVKEPKNPKNKGPKPLENDCDLSRMYTPSQTVFMDELSDTEDTETVQEPSPGQNTGYVRGFYEHYHASHVNTHSNDGRQHNQVPLPGEYAHYEFSKEARESAKIAKEHRTNSTGKTLLLTTRQQLGPSNPHFPPHETFVDKSELQKTYPVTLASGSTCRQLQRSGMLLGSKVNVTDRGVGEEEIE